MIFKFKNIGTCAALLAMVSACRTVPHTLDGKKLVWHDEFNYRGLPDSSKWNYDVGNGGYGNNEAQFYTEKRLENARVEGGKLVIEARREQWKGSEYTSARLLSRGKYYFRYGTVEVRAKLPKGRGTWPAIWAMSENMKQWPDDGEIDIMEHVGYHPGYIHATIHTKKYNWVVGTQKTDSIEIKDASEKFHLYKMDWDKDKIDMYVDGAKFFSYANTEKNDAAWPFDQPFFIVLNQAIGGNWGGKEGIDDTVFPQKFYIDYVRIYQK